MGLLENLGRMKLEEEGLGWEPSTEEVMVLEYWTTPARLSPQVPFVTLFCQ